MSNPLLFEGEHGPIEIDISKAPADSASGGLRDAGLDMVSVAEAHAALGPIKEWADAVYSELAALAKKPDETTVEFGVKLAGEGNVIFAKGSAGAHLTVKLVWKS